MKPDLVTTATYPVRSDKEFMSTRELGRTVLRDMEDHLPTGTAVVIIDFSGVVAITASFADEFLGHYYSSLASHSDPPATVALQGLNEDLRETVVMCLERRDLVALESHGGGLTLLAAPDVLVETFELAKTLGAFTAMNVAERLSITAPNANNRLKRLVSGRALIRERRVAERGGKEFGYSLPRVTPSSPTG
jgi:hypothetical protein